MRGFITPRSKLTKAPEGYEQDESLAGTPYGKTYTTMAEVDELFTFEGKKQTSTAKVESLHRSLYGHDKTDSTLTAPTGKFVGLANGSEAEGWLYDAVDFWEEHSNG